MLVNYKKINNMKSFELIRIKDDHKKEFFQEHRHNYYELIFITEGYGKHSIDFQEYELKKDLLYIIKPTQIHKWLLEEFHNEYDGYIFLFTKELFQNDQIIDTLFGINIDPTIVVCPQTKSTLTTLLSLIENEYYQDNDCLLISYLFSSFLHYILKSKKKIDESIDLDKRVVRLTSLIEKYYRKEKSASFYAKEFEITTKRLNEIIKKNINLTVSELINNKVIIEAKRELLYGKLSIKHISQKLGFLDSSYFSRFFKKHTTFSPQNFREKNVIKQITS